MRYEEAMEFVTSLTKSGFNFGLGRTEELLKRLGSPHLGLKIVHVGGTNGKGSTTSMIASIIKAAGYRAGTFTSPHLHSYTERYRVNGVEITREKVAGLIAEMRCHLEAMVAEGFEHPTEFEVGTALALLYFSRELVDYLVLEVGLGGAIDATNVVTPVLSVITNISMDHMDYLGDTVQKIAREKAGVIKQGIPLVTAAAGEGLEIIRETCREKNSRLIQVGRDVTWNVSSISEEGQCFNVYGHRGTYSNLTIQLLGRHQLVNAAVAVAAAEILMEKDAAINEDALRKGLAAACWPGRFDIVSREPLVIIDGAHNYEGARCLRCALEEYFPGRRQVLVIGMLEDKDRARVTSELTPGSRAVVVTRPNSPRSGNWQEIAAEAGLYVDEVYLVEDVREAVKKALCLARPEDLVCITGSIYMIAEAREYLMDIK